MTERVQVGGLQVAKALYDFINNEAIPGTGIAADKFWAGAEAVINELAPKNRALLAKRDELQAQIDAWHQARKGQAHDAVAYKAFLGKYLPNAIISDDTHNYGYSVASTLAEVLKRAGDNLTRANIMKQAASLKDFEAPLLRPGIKINTSATDFYPIQAVRLGRVKGQSFDLFGDILANESK